MSYSLDDEVRRLLIESQISSTKLAEHCNVNTNWKTQFLKRKASARADKLQEVYEFLTGEKLLADKRPLRATE